jgi:hypothetical protein
MVDSDEMIIIKRDLNQQLPVRLDVVSEPVRRFGHRADCIEDREALAQVLLQAFARAVLLKTTKDQRAAGGDLKRV